MLAASLLALLTPLAGDEVVVLGPDGEPRSGVAVFAVDARLVALLALERDPAGPASFEELLLASEPTGVSDERGVASLHPRPDGGGPLLCVAADGKLRGTALAGAPDTGPSRLRLAPVPTVEAQVLDPAGHPLPGVLVALEGWRADMPVGSQPAGRTDDDGWVRVRLFSPALALAGADAFTLTLVDVHGPLPVRTPLDPSAQDEVVVLHAPATGSVRFVFVDEHGAPTEPGGLAATRAVDGFTLERFPVPVEGSELRLPHVAVGTRVRLEVLGGPRGELSAETEGPARAGEEVVHTVTVRAPPPYPGELEISGTVVDADGTPAAHAQGELELHWESPEFREFRTRPAQTDAAGRFLERVRLDGAATGSVLSGELRVTRANGAALVAWFEAEVPRAGEGLAVGQLELRLADLCVAGRVVDAAGAPAPGARVEICDYWYSMDDGARNRARRVELTADGDGRFELRGTAVGGEMEVRAERGDASTAWLPFGRGDAEVELVLRPSATVEGHLRLPDGVRPSDIRLELVSAEAIPDGVDAAVSPNRDGTFRTGPVPAGSADLYVWIAEEHGFATRDLPVRVVRALDAGGPPDLRLAPLDLCGRLYVYDVAVLGPDGEPAKRPVLHHLRGPGTRWKSDREVSRYSSGLSGKPRHRLVALDRPLFLRIEQEGLRTRTLRLARERTDVRLEAGLPVRLVVLNQPELGDGFLAVRFRRKHTSATEADLDTRGIGLAALPEPGTYELHFQVCAIRSVGPMHSRLSGPAALDFAPEITVEDVADEQAFAIELDGPTVELFRAWAERR